MNRSNPLDDIALVGTIDLKVTGVPILGDIEVLRDKDLRIPLGHLLVGGLDQGKFSSDAAAKLNLGGLTQILEIIRQIKALLELLRQTPSADLPPPITSPTLPPSTDHDPYPDGVKLVAVHASHPNHPGGVCPITEDNVIHPPESWGTTNFDDGTHFVLNVGYTLGEKDLGFPEGSRLDRTSRLVFAWDSVSAVLSATENYGGGFMADGGQIRKEYDRTRGMDPVVKFKTGPTGGPADGATVSLELSAPIDDKGTHTVVHYTFASFN